MNYILGEDHSHWQAKVDFEKLLVNNIRFGIFKAGEIPTKSKTEYLDDMYARNIREAKANDIISGAYYFFHPSIGASRQAKHFIKIVKTYGMPDLPLVVDVEVADGMQPIGASAVLKAMLDQLEAEFGEKPIIYSRWGVLHGEYGNPAWLGTDSDTGYKLWLAQYNNVLDRKPADMRNVIMWQYTDKLKLPGIGVALDGNYWLRSEAELWKLANYYPEIGHQGTTSSIVVASEEKPAEPIVSEAYKRALVIWNKSRSEGMNSIWWKLRNWK